ncbi:hypothetical protein COOONC_14067 [Cooperia oncophora]
MNCEIQVVGDQFQSDPCRRSHACVSVNVLGDKVERREHQFDIYFVALRKYLLQKCSEIRKDPRYRKLTTTEILEDMLEEYEADGTMRAEDRQEMMLSFHRGNLNSIRSAIAKYFADMLYFVIMAQAYHKVKGITWDNIPQSLSHLRDGTQFLQLRTPQLQLYYSLKTIEKAYHNGLCVSAADGVHKIMYTAAVHDPRCMQQRLGGSTLSDSRLSSYNCLMNGFAGPSFPCSNEEQNGGHVQDHI